MRSRGAEPLAGLAKQAHGERVHGVAGVDRNRNPARAMHRGDAAPPIAAVLDVVVDKKGVVQHFQTGGGRERILAAPAERPSLSRCRGRGAGPCRIARRKSLTSP